MHKSCLMACEHLRQDIRSENPSEDSHVKEIREVSGQPSQTECPSDRKMWDENNLERNLGNGKLFVSKVLFQGFVTYVKWLRLNNKGKDKFRNRPSSALNHTKSRYFDLANWGKIWTINVSFCPKSPSLPAPASLPWLWHSLLEWKKPQ